MGQCTDRSAKYDSVCKLKLNCELQSGRSRLWTVSCSIFVFCHCFYLGCAPSMYLATLYVFYCDLSGLCAFFAFIVK